MPGNMRQLIQGLRARFGNAQHEFIAHDHIRWLAQFFGTAPPPEPEHLL